MSQLTTRRTAGLRYPTPRNRMAGLADQDMGNQSVPMMVDGISMNAGLRFLPERSFPAYYGHLHCIRQQRDHYQPRWITLPFDAAIAIGGGETDITTQTLSPGSLIWGLGFTAIDGNLADFEVQITDICANRSLFSTPVNGEALSPTGVTGLRPTVIEPVCIYAGKDKPQLKVEISNKTTTDQRCQLLIYVAEPCDSQLGRPDPVRPGADTAYPWNQGQPESPAAPPPYR